MKVKDVISKISATDKVCIVTSDDTTFNGLNQDFKTTCEWAKDVLECEVDRIRSYNSVTIILM